MSIARARPRPRLLAARISALQRRRRVALPLPVLIGLRNDHCSRGLRVRSRGMASELSVRVGGVQIGGGAPVVVQSMTLTKTHDVPATTAQIAALASAGCEIVRVAVPKTEDAEALLEDRPLLADADHRRHPLQREPRAEGDRSGRRGRPDQPRQHRRPGQGRRGRHGGEEGRDPDADRRELGLAAEASRDAGPGRPGRGARRGRARRGAAAREPRLLRLQDLRQIEPCADDDPRVPNALGPGAVPASPRRHRGGPAVHRLDQERDRPGQPARRRDRRHDPRQPHRRPGRRGQGRLGDPQVARLARARPDADRLPELWPRQRRRPDPRRGGRGAPGHLPASTSRSPCSAAR